MVINSSLGSSLQPSSKMNQVVLGGQFNTLCLKGDYGVCLLSFFSTLWLFCSTFCVYHNSSLFYHFFPCWFVGFFFFFFLFYFFFSYFLLKFHSLLHFLIWSLLSSLHIHKKKSKCLFCSSSICLAVWFGSIHGQLDFLLKLNTDFQSQIGNKF